MQTISCSPQYILIILHPVPYGGGIVQKALVM
jgi:hypothetical protein